MTTEKPQIIRQIEELLGKKGLELHPAPNYSSAASPLARLMAVKKHQAKYLLDEQGRLVGLNLAGMELDDGLWGKIAALLEKEGVRLQALNLCGNQLEKFVPPLGIAGMIELDLEDNPLLSYPPPEAMKEGRAVVLRFLQDAADEGTMDIWEVKMLIVGEENSGKTTLWNLLQDPSYPVPSPRDKTVGIQVKEWTFDAPDRKNVSIRVHLWDFGGQEIQYMTHHFFLTRRSVYVLLTDGSKDSANFLYWLHIIDLLGCDDHQEKNLPVLVVLNELKCKKPQLPCDPSTVEKRLRLDLIRRDVDFKEKGYRLMGIFEDIKDLICNKTGYLPLTIPKSWGRVRVEIDNLRHAGKNHITYDEFESICIKNVTNDKEKQSDPIDILKIFHNVGFVLYFDERGLKDFIVLNPKWAVDAVYAVLRSSIVEQVDTKESSSACLSVARFSLDDFEKEWKLKGITFDEQEKLLAMMLKKEFGICFETQEGEKEIYYIVPQLLPELSMEELRSIFPEWNVCANVLRHSYHYQFMPKGIIGRVITRLNEKINTDKYGQKMVWKNAVFLKHGQCIVLILLLNGKGERLDSIQIAIHYGTSDERKALLDTIRGEMGKVNSFPFKNLLVSEKIPCCCKKCLEKCLENAEAPFEHELTELQKDAKEGRTMAQCQQSRILVNVRELLKGVPCEEMKQVSPELPPDEEISPRPPSEKKLNAFGKRDVFMCHASEDKEQVVRPLVADLEEAGFSCWLDESEIKWGDSIPQKINEGLSMSQYVMVVLSLAFVKKGYPQKELHAALHLEASLRAVKVLPLLVGTAQEKEEILKWFPLLNDKLHLSWEGSSSEVVSALRSRIAPTTSNHQEASLRAGKVLPLLVETAQEKEALPERLLPLNDERRDSSRKKTPKPGKKIILVLAANPEGTKRLYLDEEIREIQEGLKRAKQRKKFDLKPIVATRSMDLRRAMLDCEPNIVHFCGHGYQGQGLAFAGEREPMEFASAETLAGLFELFPDTECVLLNACYSEEQAEAIFQHVPCVIGMKGEIEDQEAREFAVAFYDALGAGKSFEFAFKLACTVIPKTEQRVEPILKIRSGS